MTAPEVKPLPMSGSSSNPPKRKEVMSSPGVLKRKYLRKVSLPFLPQLAVNGKCLNDHPTVESPSAFEEELADQENQSPNDPEFVRRASQRWRRKTGAVNHEPLQLLHQCRGRDLLPAAHYTKFQWPTSPSQQPAFQRRVSPQPIHYMDSPFVGVPAVPLGSPQFQRSSRQYSSMFSRTTKLEEPFQRSTRQYSSLMTQSNCRRKNSNLDSSSAASSCENLATRSRKNSLFWSFGRRSKTPGKGKSSKAKSIEAKKPKRLSFDDSVADDIRRAAQREHLQVETPGWATPLVPVRRMSVRVRQSLRTPKLGRRSRNTATVTPSTSYQSDLSTSSSFSSTSSCSTSPPGSPSLSSSSSQGQLSFQDIFVSEPQIAEKFVRILRL